MRWQRSENSSFDFGKKVTYSLLITNALPYIHLGQIYLGIHQILHLTTKLFEEMHLSNFECLNSDVRL